MGRYIQQTNTIDGAWLMAMAQTSANADNTINALVADSDAMNLIAINPLLRSSIGVSGVAYTAINGSSMATAKYAAGWSGLNPVDYAAMADIIASSTAMTAIAASSTAMTAIAASSTAMAAIAASSTAMADIIASSTAMTAIAASSTAMAAIWASNSATNAMMASSAARLAVYYSDTALAQLQYTPAQVQRLITENIAMVNSNMWGGAVQFEPNGKKLIILRRYYSSTSDKDCISWRRDATAIGQGPTAGAGGRTLYTNAAHRGCISGTYTDSGTYAANNDTGNFVCAANGLHRNASVAANAVLTVYYIKV